MVQDRDDRQGLLAAAESVWRALRGGELEAMAPLLLPTFRVSGFPLDVPVDAEATAGSPEAARPAEGKEKAPDLPEPARRLGNYFREGSGLTNLHHLVEGAELLDRLGVVQLSWMAEKGLGQGGSPRYVSGRATLAFQRERDSWLLGGWIGVAGPHRAEDAQQRAADVEAIREQILRVFEAYRQKDQSMLRRTHTADWRGFALSSGTVGKGIDAYMRAAQRAMGSMQFEEYQIAELDAIFYGDLAIVPYVAVVAGKTAQGRKEQSRLRVMDVYLREPSGWNQVASNVCLHPEEMRGV